MATVSARAIVRIGALPDSSLKRVLRGTVDSSRAASKQVSDASKAEAKEYIKAQKQKEREATRAARAQVRAAEKAAREEVALAKQATKAQEADRQRQMRVYQRLDAERIRDARRAAAQLTREMERSARDQLRAAERAVKQESRLREKAARAATREAARVRDRNRTIGFGVAGAAVGAGGAALDVVQRGQGVAGVRSREEMIRSAGLFERSLILTANEAKNADGTKVSAEQRMAIRDNVLQASKDTNIALEEFAAALATAQSGFDAFNEFAAVMPQLAKISAGKNIPLADLVNVLGVAKTGLGLSSPEEMMRFADMMITTAERGSIEAGSVARDIGPMMAGYAQQSGRGGFTAASELMAFTQVLGQMQPGDSGAVATQIEAFMFSLRDKDTQNALKNAGVNIFEKDGKTLRGIADIGKQMAASDKFREKSQIIGDGGIFGRKEAYRAAIGLVNAYDKAGTDAEGNTIDPFLALQNVTQGEGLAQAQSGLDQLKGTKFFQAENIGVTAQADTVKDADRMIAAMSPWVKTLTEVQTEFPALTEAMGTLTDALKLAAAAMLGGKLLGGGARGIFAGAGAGAGGAATAAGGGMLAKAGGLLGKAGLVGAAGAAGYFGTKGLLGLAGITDEKIEAWGGGLAGGVERASGRGITQSIAADSKTPVEVAPIALDANTLRDLKQNGKSELVISIKGGSAQVEDMYSDGGGPDISVDTGSMPVGSGW